jgi:hypothetical protein
MKTVSSNYIRHNRNPFKRIALCALASATIAVGLVSSVGAAPMLHPRTEPIAAAQTNASVAAPTVERFKGVDTIIVDQHVGPNDRQLANTTASDAVAVITATLQQIFSNAAKDLPVSGVTIKPIAENHDQVSVEYLSKPNVVLVTFILSARQEMIAGKPVKVGAITWEIRHFNSRLSFSGDGVSYPFVMPDTQDELMHRIRDGVLYLASKLPRQFVCDNKYGVPTKECPDCSLNACHFGQEYMEKP